MPACTHPPKRLYTGWANNEKLELCLWVACCACDKVLSLDAARPRPIRRTHAKKAS